MKDFDLRFSVWWSDDDVADLLTIDMTAIPQTGGVYVLGTTSTPLVYPWGTSPIYYIGQSSDVHKRLKEHRQAILAGRQFGEYWEKNWWPRYQYAFAFGADCGWFSSSRCKMTPEELEASIISEFYWYLGSTPVANGAWPREKIREKRRA